MQLFQILHGDRCREVQGECCPHGIQRSSSEGLVLRTDNSPQYILWESMKLLGNKVRIHTEASA